MSKSCCGLDARKHRRWFARHPQGRHAELRSDRKDQIGDHGMDMKMPVGIDVVERQAGRSKCLELGADLRSHLPAQRRPQRELQSKPEEVATQPSRTIDETG